MIRGIVNPQLEAVIDITVTNSKGGVLSVPAVIDTGFSAWLTLPPNMIAALGWRWDQLFTGTLADGSNTIFDVYAGTIVWDGNTIDILVQAADSVPLVGMALIEGFELTVEAVDQGIVTLKRM